MKKYLAIIVGIILLTLLLEQAWGEVESIEYFDNRYLLDNKPQPTVCVHDPENFNNAYTDDELFNFVKDSVEEWETGLNKYSNGNSFSINLLRINNATGFGEYTMKFRQCDVNINFMGAPVLNIQTGGYIAGGVWHHNADRTWSDIIIYTWSYLVEDPRIINGTKVPHYKAVPTHPNSLSATISHELGHSWGLRHYKLNDDYGATKYEIPFAERSIMYAITSRDGSHVKEITEFDILAILTKYSTDGWAGYTNFPIDNFKIYRSLN